MDLNGLSIMDVISCIFDLTFAACIVVPLGVRNESLRGYSEFLIECWALTGPAARALNRKTTVSTGLARVGLHLGLLHDRIVSLD